MGLGDAVSRALALVGVTEARVSAWVGRPCGCKERREKLNQLGSWAVMAARLGAEKARAVLARVTGGAV